LSGNIAVCRLLNVPTHRNANVLFKVKASTEGRISCHCSVTHLLLARLMHWLSVSQSIRRPLSYLYHTVKRCRQTPASGVINKWRQSHFADNTCGVTVWLEIRTNKHDCGTAFIEVEILMLQRNAAILRHYYAN